MSAALVRQRLAGVVLSIVGWLVLLPGLGQLFLAALANHGGERGEGLDRTLAGAFLCGLAVLLGGPGVVLWARAEARLEAAARRAR